MDVYVCVCAHVGTRDIRERGRRKEIEELEDPRSERTYTQCGQRRGITLFVSMSLGDIHTNICQL